MKIILLLLIRVYKRGLSPFLPSSCRFYPSCSDYAFESIKIHGIILGAWMAFRRIVRCHPFNSGGYDPVPGKHKHIKCKPGSATVDLSKHYEIL